MSEPVGVVAWRDLVAYFRDCREQVIGEMGRAENERQMYQAQGKLVFLSECLNLPETFAILERAKKEGQDGSQR